MQHSTRASSILLGGVDNRRMCGLTCSFLLSSNASFSRSGIGSCLLLAFLCLGRCLLACSKMKISRTVLVLMPISMQAPNVQSCTGCTRGYGQSVALLHGNQPNLVKVPYQAILAEAVTAGLDLAYAMRLPACQPSGHLRRPCANKLHMQVKQNHIAACNLLPALVQCRPHAWSTGRWTASLAGHQRLRPGCLVARRPAQWHDVPPIQIPAWQPHPGKCSSRTSRLSQAACFCAACGTGSSRCVHIGLTWQNVLHLHESCRL